MSSEEVHASKSVQEEQNVKHFQCKKCKTFFTSKAQQEEHDLVVHDKEKKNKCNICEKSFGHLKSHVKTVHGNNERFQCNLCEKSFAVVGTLKRHITTVHEKIKDYVKCNICEKLS